MPGDLPSVPAEPAPSGPSQRLADYVAGLRKRLERRQWLWAAALSAGAVLLLTLGGSYLAIRDGFDPGTLLLTRLLLLAALAACAVGLIVRPVRRYRREAARTAEALAPELDGRLVTWSQLRDRSNPFRELLADDALALAVRIPAEHRVPRHALGVPAVLAVGLAAALVWLAAAGPGLYRYGARELWAGWLVGGLGPPERIALQPGNEAVRRGGSVPVLAQMQGFEPPSAQLHARIGSGAWQIVPMSLDRRGFTFTFFSVRSPVSYYVSAAGVRSDTYHLHVVDVPNIDRLTLTYHYPAWTGLPDQTQRNGGDISAMAGTRVELQFQADAPLARAELVLDGHATALHTAGRGGSGQLQVRSDARYYLAALIGGQPVRLTEDYLIKVLPERAPVVSFKRPDRDYGASPIEEVVTQLQARDEYGLKSLQLRYSVNGGNWHAVSLPAQGHEVSARHVFMLESLRPDAAHRSLEPGDLISYYAVARDAKLTARTAMYFIDVQPFDRRYSQSQAMSNGGGQGGGPQQITQRQRQILVSTWNLIRERSGPSPAGTAQAPAASAPGGSARPRERRMQTASIVNDAKLLSQLQQQLAQEARSLSYRAGARQLTQNGPIKAFVSSMRKAAQAMRPAARHLGSIQLQAAISPEQQALQQLMRAQAQFPNEQIAMRRGGGGSGSQADQDFGQLYQLEMDLKKNRYETSDQATPQQGQERQTDQLARRLRQLAQRQQQLAAQMQRSRQITPEQRWQQQSLQRQAEQLQAQLQQLGQSGPGRRTQGASTGSASRAGAAGSGTSSVNPVVAQLQTALRAMQEAGQAMRADQPGALEHARAAAQAAQRQLASAGEALSRQQAARLQRTLQAMVQSAGQLYRQQATVNAQLQQAANSRSSSPNSGFGRFGRFRRFGPFGRFGPDSKTMALAQDKLKLANGVMRLQAQMQQAARSYRSVAPQTARGLTQAGQPLRTAHVVNQLQTAAQFIERGDAGYVVASESAVTDALRSVRDRLQQVASAAPGQLGSRRDPVSDELARLRSLRDRLQQLADQSTVGSARSTAAGASGAQGRGRTGAAHGGGALLARGLGAGGAGLGGGGPWGALPLHDNVLPINGHPTGPPPDPATLQRHLRTLANATAALGPVLRQRGLGPEDLRQVEQLSRELTRSGLDTRVNGVAGRIERSVHLIEQLELQLSKSTGAGREQAVRTAVNDPVADRYRAAVAEYYRRLSRE